MAVYSDINKKGNGVWFPNNLHTHPRFIELHIKKLKVLNSVPMEYERDTIDDSNTGNIAVGAVPALFTGMKKAATTVEQFADLEYKEETIKIINLPLPVNLSSDFAANWNGAALSPLEYAIREWAANGKDWGVMFQAYGQRMALSGLSLFAKKAAGRAGVSGGTVDAAGRSVLKGAGLVMNPYQQLVYSGPSFRTFSFDWVLSPSNAAEAEAIREITWYLKKYMHTSSTTSDMFFTFPAYCEVHFVDQKYGTAPFLFAIRKSAITKVNVNHERKFHKDGASVATRLGIDLLESVILTQEDFGDEYRPSSTGSMDLISEEEINHENQHS